MVWLQSWQRATWPPSAAVRQPSMALITFIWARLTWPALAARQAAPWSRKISATSRAGRDTSAWLGRRLLPPCRRRQQPIEWAGDSAQHVGGNVCVARRRVELGVPEQDLDHAHINAALQQMGGEGMPQGMRRDPGAQACRLRRHVADAVELAGRDRQQRIAAGERSLASDTAATML